MSNLALKASAGGAGGAASPLYVDDVFSTNLYTGNGSSQTINNGIDLAGEGGLVWMKSRNASNPHWLFDTARGVNKLLQPNLTDAQITTASLSAFKPDGFVSSNYVNNSGENIATWTFRKAPKFFDVVTYTGNLSAGGRYVSHNLGVTPGFIVVKRVDSTGNWTVGHRSFAGAGRLNATIAFSSSLTAGNAGNNGFPDVGNSTSTQFFVANGGSGFGDVNTNGAIYVAYLFASLPGISKVDSYTGNGSSQTINCGFSAGCRFILIKRTDSTGDWYVWDSARGIIADNDPHLSLNTPAAEVTTDDSVDPATSGFIVNQVAATNVNVTGATYIYLAIA